jgi:hypothetical protein
MSAQSRVHRISCARLLKRVFKIDMQPCPNCGSREFKINSPTLERTVIEKTLTHLELDSLSPAHVCLGRARGRLKFLSAA